MLHSSVVERLDRLAPDQRAAATSPPGPVLCVAPAGSGKTTTLVARISWLVASGAEPGGITAVTFNKRAADEMASRVDAALEPLGLAAGSVRVKTFHALGREILADAGAAVEPLLDRETVLREMWPDISRGAVRRLDDAFSRLKLDVGVTAGEVATDPEPGPVARAFLAYEAALAESGGLDFDDLVGRALRLLESRSGLLRRWRERCRHLLVDETQDVDRTQLRLALLLAAPANSIFLVGDDDQTIYGWRLADVRRVLGLAESLAGLKRLDLTVNYRCPPAVVERAVRLVSRNEERFAKRIDASSKSTGRLILAPDGSDDSLRLRRIVESWPEDGGTRAILARTNVELLPAASVALDLGLEFNAPRLRMLTEDPRLDIILQQAAADEASQPETPLPARLVALARAGLADRLDEGRGRLDPLATNSPPPLPAGGGAGGGARADAGGGTPVDPESRSLDEPLPIDSETLVASLVAWAAPYRDVAELAAAVAAQRSRLAALRHEGANLTLATAHSTKGLEFDHVAVIGMESGRFPSARSLRESTEPVRALEEERRLAYVAWTRARRSLTLLFDPQAPSPFLLEAFSEEELGLEARGIEERAGPEARPLSLLDASTT